MPWREPAESAWSTLPTSALLSLRPAKFQKFRRSLYRALLTKNRKLLGWLPRPFTRATAHVHDVHPCFHVPQSSRFVYHRFNVSTPFSYCSPKTHPEFLPHSVPSAPISRPRRSRYRGMSRKKGWIRECRSSSASTQTTDSSCINREITIKLNIMLRPPGPVSERKADGKYFWNWEYFIVLSTFLCNVLLS